MAFLVPKVDPKAAFWAEKSSAADVVEARPFNALTVGANVCKGALWSVRVLLFLS